MVIRTPQTQMRQQTQKFINNPPFFVDLLKDHPSDEKTSKFNKEDFIITDLTISEAVNGSSVAFISLQMVSNQKHYFNDTIKTIDDFLKSQIFKHVTLCSEYPYPVDPKKDPISQKTYFHGIVWNYNIVFGFPYDVIKLEVRSYFDLLKLQNNYRTFENKNIKDILTSVFQYYSDGQGGGLVGNRFKWDCSEIIPDNHTSTRIQVLQLGESDYEFVLRLLKEEGLSYFFYHTQETCVFGMTPDLVETLQHYENDKKPEFTYGAPLPYRVNPVLTTPISMQQHQGPTPVFGPDFFNHIWVLNNFRKYGALESVATQLSDYNASFDFRFHNDSDGGGELHSKIKKKKGENTVSEDIKPPFQLQWREYLSSQSNDPAADTEKISDYIVNKQVAADSLRKNHMNYSYHGDGVSLTFLSLLRKTALSLNTGSERPGFLSEASKISHEFITYGVKLRYRSSNVSSQNYSYAVQPSIDGLKTHYFEFSLDLFLTGKQKFSPPFESEFIDSSSGSKYRSHHQLTAEVVAFTDQDKKEMQSKKSKAQNLIPNMIRIRFPWQKSDESTLARMSFSWTGKEYGSLFLPEVGSEVIVTFVDNNQDYPIIVGCLYNTNNPYPSLPNLEQLDLKTGLGARGIQFTPTEEGACIIRTPYHPDDPKTAMTTLFIRAEELLKTRALGNASTDVISGDAEFKVLKKDHTYTLSVGKSDEDSSMTMTGDKIDLHSSSNNSLTITKDGKAEIKTADSMTVNSKEITVTGKQKVEVSGSNSSITVASGKIDANSLQIQK